MTLDEQIDEILYDLDLRVDSGQAYIFDTEEAKQAITSLIKELVAEAKPELPALFAGLNDIGVIMYKKGTDEFEQNLLKALEEK